MVDSRSVVFNVWYNENWEPDCYSIAVSGALSVDNVPYTYIFTANSLTTVKAGDRWHTEELTTQEFDRLEWDHLGRRVALANVPLTTREFVLEELCKIGRGKKRAR